MNEKEQEHTENFITATVDAYIRDREKDWQEIFRIHKLWLWTFVVIALASIFLCAMGIRFFVEQGKEWNGYIIRQTVLSEERAERELKQELRNDSLAKEYIREMSEYKRMPYYPRTSKGTTNAGKTKDGD
jgi:hypothetical protein